MTSPHPIEPAKEALHSKKVQNLRRLAFLLDNSIPIPFTRYRMGIDPILGLLGIVGGTGDIIGGALGAYIVVQAARMGVEPQIIGQMLGNLLLDSFVGVVPGLGDLLDVTWKANDRNVRLLDQYFETHSTLRKNNPLFIFGLIILLALIVIGFASLMVFIFQRFVSQF